MNDLDLSAYALSKYEKERLKDYTIKLVGSNDLRTREMLYSRIRNMAKVLSDINEARVVDINNSLPPTPITIKNESTLST